MLLNKETMSFDKAIYRVIITDVYYAHFLSVCSRVEDNKIDTIDFSIGYNSILMRYNPDFMSKIEGGIAQQIREGAGYIIHNLAHLMLYHPMMRMKPGINKDIFDIAADLSVNQYIPQNDRIALPSNSITHDMFGYPENLTTMEYYQLLINDFDVDDDKAKNNKEIINNLIKSNTVKHEWKPEEGNGNIIDYDNIDTEILKQIIDNAITDAANQAKMAGNLTGNINELVNLIIKNKKPVIDWRTVLRRMVGSAYSCEVRNSKMRRSRRMKTFPGIRNIRKPDILVAIDTSGSISNDDLSEFFSELAIIYRLTRANIEIVECDTQISHVYQYKGIAPVEIHGRGGTDFNAPLEYSMKKKPNLIIYFTDGYASNPTVKGYTNNIIWVICSSGISTNPGLPGIVVKMKHDDFL